LQRHEEPKFATKVRVPAELRNFDYGSNPCHHQLLDTTWQVIVYEG